MMTTTCLIGDFVFESFPPFGTALTENDSGLAKAALAAAARLALAFLEGRGVSEAAKAAAGVSRLATMAVVAT
jgi:hypothetical protein